MKQSEYILASDVGGELQTLEQIFRRFDAVHPSAEIRGREAVIANDHCGNGLVGIAHDHCRCRRQLIADSFHGHAQFAAEKILFSNFALQGVDAACGQCERGYADTARAAA